MVDGNNINTLQTADITATVGTNNLTGYTLTMSSTTTDLVNNVMLDDSQVIHTLDENVTAANFATNRWGISYDNGANYQPFTTSHQFEPTTGPTNQDTTSLKAGVKSDIHTGAGLYSNTISFMAVANHVPVPVTLTFDANGGTFEGGAATNVLTYSEPEIEHVEEFTSTTDSTTASGTHKSSVTDGLQYASSANYYQDLKHNTTDPGPYELTIYFATQNVSHDWICVFDGTSYTPLSSDGCTNASAATPTLTTSGGGTISGKKVGGGGSNKTAYTSIATYKLNSKTARIYFHSNSSSNSYGFWAEFAGGGDMVVQHLISGTYTEPTRTDNLFLGWATAPNATVPDYNLDEDDPVLENTTVYAVWQKITTFDKAFAEAGKSKQGDYYKMQDMTSNICSAVQPNDVGISAQLLDTRDEKVYWVAKLADGKCWMTQNLDYDLDATIHGDAKTSSSVSGWTDDSYKPFSYDGGNYYSANGIASSADFTAITCTAADNGGENCHYHIGNHYNWTAAINSTDSSGYTTEYFNAPDSICPTGWKLPTVYIGTSSSIGDFKALNNAYGGITANDSHLRAAPLYFTRLGYVLTGSLYQIGLNNSGYWSSTIINVPWAKYMSLGDTWGADPENNNFRDYGYSVRCLAQ